MTFRSIREIADAELAGQTTLYTFRKTPSQVTTQGVWFDLSLSPGNPVPQYYASAPLVAVQMRQSDQGGIFHGADVSGSKVIRTFGSMLTTATALPMPMILCDYLLYYPFVDEGVTDPQALTNSVGLPRYTDGQGVQVMAVSVAGRTGGQTFQITYTNQSNVSGRTSVVVLQNSAAANGSIVTTQTAVNGSAGPFLPLQAGDTGVRSIQSVQMISGSDVGLFALVLVKPLLTTLIRGIDAPVEVDPALMQGLQLPEIKNDAYLNLLCLPNGSLSGSPIHGYLKTVWN